MEMLNIDHRGHLFEEYNVCPCCHIAMKPSIEKYALGEKRSGDYSSITIIWKCPVRSCLQNVVTVYYYNGHRGESPFYVFGEFLNGSPVTPAWPDFLQKLQNGNPDDPAISEPSKFTEIYKQALTAEFKGLNEIAGIGYRRAFEFLIKDFAIAEHPSDKADIMSLQLVPVIKKYFPIEYLPLMERAAWLGNDETHYERKHPDYDIQDLKRIIAFVITDLDGKKQREAIITGISPKK
jgi:hypothetical protein